MVVKPVLNSFLIANINSTQEWIKILWNPICCTEEISTFSQPEKQTLEVDKKV